MTSSDAADVFETAAEALRPDLSQRPRLREAARQLESGRHGPAIQFLEEFLQARPRDVAALYLFSEAAQQQGAESDAEMLLARCLKLAPDFLAARFSYANLLLRMNRPEPALAEADELLKRVPRNPLAIQLKAVVLQATQDFAAAAALWHQLTEDYPKRPGLWVSYGHVLRVMGAQVQCIAAYRKAIALDPGVGDAWWGLADLKTLQFSDVEVEKMEAQRKRPDINTEVRPRLCFALGKAYADQKQYAKSFECYNEGNTLYRTGFEHDPDILSAYVARCRKTLTADFFRERSGAGCGRPDPIFLVGMMRSGSTLVEQILASHSQIEGTKELSNLAAISRQLQAELGTLYPQGLEQVDPSRLRTLGEQYLTSTRAHRKTTQPFFLDKMGANFAQVGLISLILPNARIVDVRRHPLASGFSIFAQIFPEGQNNSYRLTDIGRLYRDYVTLAAHFDSVLPGKVHRIFYERLIADPETEVRRLLDYLGLPFEQACMEFYKTDRVVTTVSSEQVRSPLYKDALEQWRHYEPWLGPLKSTLGPVLDAYPAVPDFD